MFLMTTILFWILNRRSSKKVLQEDLQFFYIDKY